MPKPSSMPEYPACPRERQQHQVATTASLCSDGGGLHNGVLTIVVIWCRPRRPRQEVLASCGVRSQIPRGTTGAIPAGPRRGYLQQGGPGGPAIGCDSRPTHNIARGGRSSSSSAVHRAQQGQPAHTPRVQLYSQWPVAWHRTTAGSSSSSNRFIQQQPYVLKTEVLTVLTLTRLTGMGKQYIFGLKKY
jgi:hypothetical protein